MRSYEAKKLLTRAMAVEIIGEEIEMAALLEEL